MVLRRSSHVLLHNVAILFMMHSGMAIRRNISQKAIELFAHGKQGKQGQSLAEVEGVANSTKAEKRCYCKQVNNAEECNVTKHGTGLDQLRYFQASSGSADGKGKCCKWAEPGGWFSTGAGRKYNQKEDAYCQWLQPNSCCHMSNGFSVYLSKVQYNKYQGRVEANLADSFGADCGGNFVPKYLTYHYIYRRKGETVDCKSITPHADHCEMGVEADKFQIVRAKPNTCCRNDKYGVSFYVSQFHTIKGKYNDATGGPEFIARRDITGAIINGKRFSGRAIQHYIAWSLRGPEWPYFCADRSVKESCNFIDDQKDVKRADNRVVQADINYRRDASDVVRYGAAWHDFRIGNPNEPWRRYDPDEPVCCKIPELKLGVYVRAYFTVPFFEIRDEDKPKPFSDLDYIVGGAKHEGQQVNGTTSRAEVENRLGHTRTPYGFICEIKTTSDCKLSQEEVRPAGI